MYLSVLDSSLFIHLYDGWEFGLVASLFFQPEIPQAVPSGVTTV